MYDRLATNRWIHCPNETDRLDPRVCCNPSSSCNRLLAEPIPLEGVLHMSNISISRMGIVGLVVLATVGCSATKSGKCRSCQGTDVYPSTTYYDSYPSVQGEPIPQGSTATPMLSAPAPIPAAEPLPLPPAVDPMVPPPPPEALRARPIDQISASSRGLYYSARDSMRALFTRE